MNNTIKLYGDISPYTDNSAEAFCQRLDEAANGATGIDLHIHSMGGSVFEGNLIYNAIRKCKVPVNIYVDGLAASMASVIMSAGQQVYMAENAFVMIHAPFGYCEGTASDMDANAKMLRSMEDIMVKEYCRRTGKTDKDVRQWLDGDNWFNAQEALDNRLIDGITDVIDKQEEDHDKEADPALHQLMQVGLSAKGRQIVASYHKNFLTNKKEMDKKRIIENCALDGVNEQSTDEEVMTALNDKLKGLADKQASAEKALNEQKEMQVKACVKRAVETKKISDAVKADYEQIGMSQGIDMLERIIGKMEAPVSLTQLISKAQPSARADWNWDKWQNDDPKGLELMRQQNPEQFSALYSAKYL